MRSPGAELTKASSRRGYLHPFKSFSTSRVPRHVEPPSPAGGEEKPKKESGGFFSQLRRSFTLGPRSSSSAAAAREAAPGAPVIPARSSKDGGAPPVIWGKRVKNGLSKPLKMVTTSYVDCMKGMAEDPRAEGFATMGFHHTTNPANAFQFSASRRLQHSRSSADEREMAYPSDAQLHAVRSSSKHHAPLISN